MINIEHGCASVADDMRTLLLSQLERDSVDSLEVIEFCVENYPSFVAYDERRNIKGMSYTFEMSKDIILLHGLHVDVESRGQRIGSMLLRSTEDRARKLGYRTIMLTNSMQYRGSGKRSAVPFYESHGYSVNHVTFNSPATHVMIKEL